MTDAPTESELWHELTGYLQVLPAEQRLEAHAAAVRAVADVVRRQRRELADPPPSETAPDELARILPEDDRAGRTSRDEIDEGLSQQDALDATSREDRRAPGGGRHDVMRSAANAARQTQLERRREELRAAAEAQSAFIDETKDRPLISYNADGRFVMTDTDVTAAWIVGRLAMGAAPDDLQNEHPGLSAEQIELARVLGLAHAIGEARDEPNAVDDLAEIDERIDLLLAERHFRRQLDREVWQTPPQYRLDVLRMLAATAHRERTNFETKADRPDEDAEDDAQDGAER